MDFYERSEFTWDELIGNGRSLSYEPTEIIFSVNNVNRFNHIYKLANSIKKYRIWKAYLSAIRQIGRCRIIRNELLANSATY